MKFRPSASLRLTIPLALTLFFSGVMIWTVHASTARVVREGRELVLGETNRLMTLVQASIERAAKKGSDELIQEELAALAAEPHIEIALLAGERGDVVAGSRLGAIGRDWTEFIATDSLPAVARTSRAAMETQVGGVHVREGSEAGYGVYPVRLGIEPGSIRPTRVGILYVALDLAGSDAAARASVARQLLPFALVLVAMVVGLGLFLHVRVAMRIRDLVRATTRFAAGDLEARSNVVGHDEIGELGVAFNDMAADLEDSQTRLQHAQKMEALGRLTTGVAHDFNNLLMGVSTTASVAMRKLAPGHPSVAHLQDIKDAARGGASIIKRMVDFSYKRAAERVDVDVDDVVAKNESMVQRLIGEDVILSVELHASGTVVSCGQGQLEQIVLNLAINARDAMQSGGALRIDTECLTLAQERPTRMAVLSPGCYVVVRIEDTGHGMDAETLERIFEPFFTTKEIGKGTGLGLATVYASCATRVVPSRSRALRASGRRSRSTCRVVRAPALRSRRRSTPRRAQTSASGGPPRRSTRRLSCWSKTTTSRAAERRG